MRERALRKRGAFFFCPLGLDRWRGRRCRGAASGGGIAVQPLLSALCPDGNEVKEEAKGSQRRT